MHPFSPSLTDNTVCAKCKRAHIDHTDRATCEACGASGFMNETKYGLICSDCKDKEIAAQLELARTAEERVLKSREDSDKRFREVWQASKISDIRLPADIFNAKLESLQAIAKEIEEDENIKNKHFELAKRIDVRFSHLSEIVAGLNKQVIDAQNEQRALQLYYNELAKKLRAEEREKIKLRDVTYRPVEPKQIKKPTAPKIKKVSQKEIREAAGKHGIPEAILQVLVIRGMDLNSAVIKAKESMGIN